MYLKRNYILTCVWLIASLSVGAQTSENAKEFSRFVFLIQNRDYSLARQCAEDLVVDNQDYIADYLCNTALLNLKIKNTKVATETLIRELYTTKNNSLKRLIAPIYYYQLFLNSSKPDSINLLLNEYNSVINKSDSYETKVDLYTILIVKRLQTIPYVSNETIHSILSQSIFKLSKNKELNLKDYIDKSILDLRMWCRLMLSNLYFLDYKATRETNPELLRNASDYSCDANDFIYIHHIRPVTRLLFGLDQPGFEGEYAKYLIANSDNKQALEVLTKRAMLLPSNKNMSALKALFNECNTGKDFKTYWNENLNAFYKPAKNLAFKTIDNQKLKISDFKGSWVYVDVWGTWCGPCRNDLPNVQKFYEETRQDSTSNVRMLTLSYNSTNIRGFMNQNNYSFPVAEIDRYETNVLNVYYFPTRFLLTPAGNLIRIPFVSDWSEMVHNFALLSNYN